MPKSGLYLVPLNIRCHNIIYNQKGPMVSRTTHAIRIMENQMEKNIEDEIETGFYRGYITYVLLVGSEAMKRGLEFTGWLGIISGSLNLKPQTLNPKS